ncbi:hypothetical protein [Paenibacillus sp. HB172176]|uniref:hypothetical protein n=1 Tax=Paenibacillus sp. HB172176 TaxID=2493690 RepID=UPI00143BB8C7|nr:hypothetical protein [Paenibacillus sp. HB172176]
MKRFSKFAWIALAAVCVVLVLGVIAAILWYQRADPLLNNGLTTFSSPEGKKIYTIELVNASDSDIDIRSISVNGGKQPDFAKLGITYDSEQTVQYFGDQTDPATEIMELHEAAIEPQLSREEKQAVFASNATSKQHTPIHYGVVVQYDKEPIREVTIRYTYLGFTKEKRITNWFDSDR